MAGLWHMKGKRENLKLQYYIVTNDGNKCAFILVDAKSIIVYQKYGEKHHFQHNIRQDVPQLLTRCYWEYSTESIIIIEKKKICSWIAEIRK